MKKTIFTLIAVSCFAFSSFSQKFAYVDTDYILENIPEFKKAQKQVDEIAEEWRKDVDYKYQEIDQLYKAYQAEQVLLPEATKIQRQKEIEQKEAEAKEFQKKKFGYEGELFQKKQELIKPIQDKVYNEVQKMATEKALDFIFDKSSGVSMLYANPKHDRSDDVLKALGYNPLPSSK